MDRDIEDAVGRTGMCIPLAAQILRLLADSGASQMEISTALSLVQHLRHHLKGSLVDEELAGSWAAAVDADGESADQ